MLFASFSVDHSEGKENNNNKKIPVELITEFYQKDTELNKQYFLSFCFRDVARKEHRKRKILCKKGCLSKK